MVVEPDAASEVPDRTISMEHFHSVLVGYLMHWHRLSLDASLFFATASLTLTAVALSSETLTQEKALTMSLLLLIISISGSLVTRTTMKQMSALRSAIQKLDEEGGAFRIGAHVRNTTIYPDEWKLRKDEQWSDPIRPIVICSTVVLPLTLACVVYAAGSNFFQWLTTLY